VAIEAPVGVMTVIPQPVDGLLGTAAETIVTVVAASEAVVRADYDTGIR
jgi:hypothetical protein